MTVQRLVFEIYLSLRHSLDFCGTLCGSMTLEFPPDLQDAIFAAIFIVTQVG